MAKKKNFESSLEQLETIVGNLEKGEQNLDQSLQDFEKGMELYKECKSYLAQAEKKIKVLTDSLEEEDYSAN